jgi:hypothetical protein
MYTQFWSESSEGIDKPEDLDVGGKIILKCIYGK